MRRLQRGYTTFLAKNETAFYEKIAQGQHPHSFVISCSDSRIVPEQIFGAAPGELFVLRNVGNLVTPENPAFAAALTYAVSHLNVENVVVLCHGDCGAVKGSKHPDHLETELQKWLAEDPYDGDTLEGAIKRNGIRQFERLREHPLVRQGQVTRGLRVLLLFFDIATRRLERFEHGTWEPFLEGHSPDA